MIRVPSDRFKSLTCYSPGSSSVELSPRCRDPLQHDSLGKLHCSYGSLNSNHDSFQTHYSDAQQSFSDSFQFMSPSKSPWGEVQLKKTSTQRPSKQRQVGGDWTDPDANALLSDFATPTASSSPWKRRMERAKQMRTQVSPPPYSGTKADEVITTNASPVEDAPVLAENTSPENKDRQKQETESKPVSSKPITGKLTAAEAEKARNEPTRRSNIQMEPKQKQRASTSQVPTSKSPKKKKKKSETKRRNASAQNLSKELAQIRALEEQLRDIKLQTKEDIDSIRFEKDQEKKELRALARASAAPSAAGSKKTLDRKLKKNRATILDLKQQNAVIREQNQRLFQDINAFRINNERLMASQTESASCYAQLKYHDDICIAENAKLNKVVAKYQETIAEHQEQLDLCNAHADAEIKIRDVYETTMDRTVEVVDRGNNRELATDLHTMVESIQ